MNTKSPEQILAGMLAKDYYTEWLGLKVDRIEKGYCELHFVVRKEMLNGFGSIHGGVLFAASDSAFAFACNTHGMVTVALDVSITYARPAFEGQTLVVKAQEIYMGNKTGVYEVKTYHGDNELISFFKGTAYRTSKSHE